MANEIVPPDSPEEAGRAAPPKSMRLASSLVSDYLGGLQERAAGQATKHVPTGISSLDRQLPAVLHEGHLVVLAGRPGMGKTALAQQIAENVAAGGRTVFFFSLEMSTHEVTERAVARRSGISIPRLKTGQVSGVDLDHLIASANAFGGLPMLIDDASFDIATLVAKAKAAAAGLVARNLPPLGAIFVDYLQLVGGSKAANRTIEVTQVSGGLKRLARELSVPVVALSQLNRGVEGRTDKRPTMSDLRESGAIEQDADLILFIYRDDYYDQASRDRGVAEIIVGKNRHGSSAITIKLKFIGDRVQFGDLP